MVFTKMLREFVILRFKGILCSCQMFSAGYIMSVFCTNPQSQLMLFRHNCSGPPCSIYSTVILLLLTARMMSLNATLYITSVTANTVITRLNRIASYKT